MSETKSFDSVHNMAAGLQEHWPMRLTVVSGAEWASAGGPRLWPRCFILVFVAGTVFYTLYSVVTIPGNDGPPSSSSGTFCNCFPESNSSSQSLFPFNLLSVDRQRLFYNRVPKCGSTTLYTLIRKLSAMHGYVHFNSKVYDKKNVDEAEQRRIVQLVKQTAPPCSFDRHVFFINFTKFGEIPPIYINIIREPVERIISSFFYRRVAARLNNRPVKVKPSAYWLNKKFERCVMNLDPECTFLEGHNYSVLQVPYFCGQEWRCQLLNDVGALQRAKFNIEHAYAVVGVLEEMNVTLQVLEASLPDFFGGAFKVYHSMGVHRNRNLQKEHVSEEVKALLKANLTAEYELYHFVLQRLYRQFRQLLAVGTEDAEKLTDIDEALP